MRTQTPLFFDNIILKRFRGKKTIYILPTKEGYYYIATCFITFLIGMGYNNNLGIMASFIMTAYLSIIMLQSNNNLKRLHIQFVKIQAGFADQKLEVKTLFQSSSPKEITHVSVFGGDQFKSFLSQKKEIPALKSTLQLSFLSNLKRGHYHYDIMKLVSTGPNHLFKTWCYQESNCSFFVYPERLIDQKILKTIQTGLKNNSFDEDFYETHIPYSLGLNPKRLDWKYYAKSEQLLWKRFNSHNSLNLKLNYTEILGNHEEKLSKLSWAIDYCQKTNLTFDLIIPGKRWYRQKSPREIEECLEALAKL